MRIALTGNPNSGKTTMYNALTGRNERVGNWAGVTVDKNESPIKRSFYEGAEELIAVDLPGAYSMSPFTSEESVTSEYVKNENPDVIINIVDATNLSRSLFFTTQLLELGIPVIVALNKSDVNKKKKTKIDVSALSQKLGCPVINTVSTSNGENGLAEVVKATVEAKGKSQKAPYIQGNINMSNKEAVMAADRKRFDFVNKIVKNVETRRILSRDKNINDRIDTILTNPLVGIPIFVVVMFLVFFISQTTLGTWLAEGVELSNGFVVPGFVTFIEWFGEWIGTLVEGADPLLQTIIVDGIIGGVGAVVGFLPLVMVMYFLIALLEDCGYMARVSVVLDPIFKRVGLSGKSVIPLVIGTGCSIPGIMAARTIRDEREKRATAMLTPFIPCGAKIPVIALFAGAFFDNAWWVSAAMYFVGILLVLFGGLLVKAITGYKYKKSFFIIELPEYKVPSLKRACGSMLSRGKDYIVKAGTIILVCNALITIMANFNWSFQMIEEGAENTSILASIASPFAVILVPLGFGVWQMAAAAITGFIAKEEVVGTLAAVYGFSAFIGEELEIIEGSSNEVKTAMVGITTVAALAYLMFNLYTPPCFAAIGAMNSEIKSKKWLFAGLCLQFGTGYTIAFLVYQIGTLLTTGDVGTGFVPGLIAVLAMVAILVTLTITSRNKLEKQYALKK